MIKDSDVAYINDNGKPVQDKEADLAEYKKLIKQLGYGNFDE